ncbi:MAG: DUF3025 domain-containing protein [Burkholderiales bacterium]|nr:DUF3025 domain-containing protein [Burkholderiales bacterium]
MQPDWPAWRARAPIAPIAPLLPLLADLPRERWPDHADWSAAARARGVCNARGLPIRFVPPSVPPPSALAFEERVLERGEVETRAACWHDAFHACAWLSFPRTKAAINALHVAEGLDDAPNGRSVVRNLLTLLDEGGLIVAAADAELVGLARAFRWHELFWVQRERVRRTMDFAIIGHALNERTLGMDFGATGRALFFTADSALLAASPAVRLAWMDAQTAAFLADPARIAATGRLQPVPINGIPGWNDANMDETYYLDTRQFRPGRRKAA